MSMIFGVGDEIIYTFAVIFLIVAFFAWWSTRVREARRLSAVVMLERRRLRWRHPNLTSYTEAETVQQGTNIATSEVVGEPNPESVDSDQSAEMENLSEVGDGEEEAIIQTMDANTNELSQRKVCTTSDEGATNSRSEQSQSIEEPHIPSGLVESSGNEDDREDASDEITIKLKYLNDDSKIVDGKLKESLDDFKKRHFHSELSDNKIVRLIYKGHVLQPDTQTLKSCGLVDDCVVHCLIHRKKPQPTVSSVFESRREGYSFPNVESNPVSHNNADIREWNFGNVFFALVSLVLSLAWYFRYVYAHMYTVTSTAGLMFLTGMFSVLVVGTFFPENEDYLRPTIHLAHERVQPRQ